MFFKSESRPVRPLLRLTALCLTLATFPAHALPSLAEMQVQFRSSDTLILDRQGAGVHSQPRWSCQVNPLI